MICDSLLILRVFYVDYFRILHGFLDLGSQLFYNCFKILISLFDILHGFSQHRYIRFEILSGFFENCSEILMCTR